MSQAKFSLGRLVATANAAAHIPQKEMLLALGRHIRGDWGELDEEDRQANETALQQGTRLFSSYRSLAGTKFWIITEHDRSATTCLLPEDY